MDLEISWDGRFCGSWMLFEVSQLPTLFNAIKELFETIIYLFEDMFFEVSFVHVIYFKLNFYFTHQNRAFCVFFVVRMVPLIKFCEIL